MAKQSPEQRDDFQQFVKTTDWVAGSTGALPWPNTAPFIMCMKDRPARTLTTWHRNTQRLHPR